MAYFQHVANRTGVLLLGLAAVASTVLCAATTRAYDTYGRGHPARYAQADYGIHGVRPEVHLSVGGHGDLGAGFRIDIPIVPEGFLRRGRDDFALSPGMDIQFYDFNRDDRRWHDRGPGPGPAPGSPHGVLLIPQLAGQWNFYFPRHAWSIFPEAGLAVVIGNWDGYGSVHVDPLIAFGARKHFASRNALVMRVGWPSGFQLGLTF